jgi:hypothetical protein
VCRQRLDRLRNAFDTPGQQRPALLALADAGAEDLPQFLRRALQAPPDGTTSAALDVIGRQGGEGWCEVVHDLLRRLRPDGPPPQPHLWKESLALLLRKSYRPEETAAALGSADSHVIGEAALLALEHAPTAALPLLRRALRSSVPCNRSTAAAVLGLIDAPWSRRELLAVLEGSDDQEATAECRAALQESRDAAARAAAWGWEEQNPHESESGPFITLAEMMLRHRPQWVRYEMEQLYERVRTLCQHLPHEGPG